MTDPRDPEKSESGEEPAPIDTEVMKDLDVDEAEGDDVRGGSCQQTKLANSL